MQQNVEKYSEKIFESIMHINEFDYEINGVWTGCVFPTGIVEKDGLLYIYYGCADKYVAVATVPLEELMEYMNSLKK